MSFRNPNGSYIRPGYDPLEVANPPTGASATAGNAIASVSFTAPTNTGGSSITNYYAVSDPGQITASSVTSPISVTGLTNGTSYTFKVWAANSYGPSAYSAPTGAVTPSPPYIEDVFSTYLYTGTGSSQTITNGINLSSDGGMLWIKPRESTTFNNHMVYDTARGLSVSLTTNDTAGNDTNALGSFNTDGFGLTGGLRTNTNGVNYVSWTFRKQAKFFDVVTYTGNGSTQNINHNLGSVPGCIIIKQTGGGDTGGVQNWVVYHRSLGEDLYLRLNLTNTSTYSASIWDITLPTSTRFTVGGTNLANANGGTYVAYLFAHDAGGFGASGNENVISCGSITLPSSGSVSANLGWEPQWVMVKATNVESGWEIYDNMRGFNATGNVALLRANLSNAEITTAAGSLNSTGFTTNTSYWSANANLIYVAIRRGPMKTPTTGTSVFSPNYASSTTGQQITTNFPVDSQILRYLPSGIGGYWFDRLRGVSSTTTESGRALYPNNTNAETAESYTRYFNNTGYQQNSGFAVGTQMIGYSFARAPGFFDVVCYTGDGNETAYNHNLGVVPELFIVKSRSTTTNWRVYYGDPAKYLNFNLTSAGTTSTIIWNNTAPTSTTFTVKGGGSGVNDSGQTYVCYLFASVTGVSKVGTYTGTGTTQQVNCGFTSGARFVLIKRTDSTGDWYVWDSARGIVAGNDPYLLLNSTAAEVTNTDYVDTYSAGFEISSTAPAAINANGGTFIFLAIA